MPDKAFLDTNLLIYAVLGEDTRSARAEELLAAGGTISVQVLNEFVSVARRKLQRPWIDVKAALQWICILCPDPVSLTIGIHKDALKIAERYGFQIYDALIVASALEADCDVLYSEDLPNGQVLEGRLTIRNPF
jgi:predicted nucleic acid-binding protein